MDAANFADTLILEMAHSLSSCKVRELSFLGREELIAVMAVAYHSHVLHFALTWHHIASCGAVVPTSRHQGRKSLHLVNSCGTRQ